ncbi:MAG: ComF family protein, partial [Candidatus Omnitrophica bacterium]|nr:ComF family protein [Candidatus Omnitrophota bacterium]MBD3269824.1 ComF family protein [Candidatus Omnitrophota bacterium]
LIEISFKHNGIETEDFDYIVPVPLHPGRLKDRGYNQSSLIAEKLSQYFQIELRDDIIHTINFTASQTKLDRGRRYQNVKDNFRAAKDVKDRNIILLDDIFTTGSTIQSCSRELKSKGAKNILAVTLARA